MAIVISGEDLYLKEKNSFKEQDTDKIKYINSKEDFNKFSENTPDDVQFVFSDRTLAREWLDD